MSMHISLRKLDELLARECRQLYSALQRTIERLHRVGPTRHSVSDDSFNRFLEEYALRNNIARALPCGQSSAPLRQRE